MESRREGEPELGGNQANTSLLPLILGVELGDLRFSFVILAFPPQLR